MFICLLFCIAIPLWGSADEPIPLAHLEAHCIWGKPGFMAPPSLVDYLPYPKEVSTPYWQAMKDALQEEKNFALCRLCLYPADYPNWRYNVFAALNCGANPVFVQESLGSLCNLLEKPVINNDLFLALELLDKGIRINGNNGTGPILHRTSSVGMAQVLARYGALNKHQQTTDVYCAIMDNDHAPVELITFYRDAKIQRTKRCQHGSPLFEAFTNMRENNQELRFKKVEQFLKDLDYEETVELLEQTNSDGKNIFEYRVNRPPFTQTIEFLAKEYAQNLGTEYE